jgi:alpha-galactosidase
MQKRKFKVTFIGAGSIVFTRKILGDILGVPEFSEIDVTFTDIDPKSLDISTRICQHDIDSNGIPVKIRATTDRCEAIKDAKYIINAIKVGGLQAWGIDMDIPLSYGVDQCVGDTLCAGGIMYGQRNVPVILGICKDIREHAFPGALFFNLSNPLAICCWAATKYGNVNTIGLCHGVQIGHLQFANIFNIPMHDIFISCVGINHCGWYKEVKTWDRDLNPELLEGFIKHPKYGVDEKVRIDMFKRFGNYCTESNGHMSEYVPWYRKHLDNIEDWISYGDVFCGETKGYLGLSKREHKERNEDYSDLLKKPGNSINQESRTEEHLSYIIEGLETGRVYRGHFNVVNNGVIKNFVDDCIVEVPCYADIHGISIPMVGELDSAQASVCNNMINVQKLATEAACTGNVEKLKQAMLLDPLNAAVLDPRQIWQMTDELLVAEEKWLPQYKKEEFTSAKERLERSKADGSYVPTDSKITGGALRKGEYPYYHLDWSKR